MTTLTKIDPKTVSAQLAAGQATLIDVREADEFAREHIRGAHSVPLSGLTGAGLALEPRGKVVFHCKSGMRTATNCATLANLVDGEAFMLDGGIEGWKQAGLPVATDAKAPLEMNRQVQITAGLLILTGVVLAATVNPLFVLLSGFVGAGLTFAGVTGTCGMANLLRLAPWNRALSA